MEVTQKEEDGKMPLAVKLGSQSTGKAAFSYRRYRSFLHQSGLHSIVLLPSL